VIAELEGLLLGTVCHRTIAQDDDIIQGLATVLAGCHGFWASMVFGIPTSGVSSILLDLSALKEQHPVLLHPKESGSTSKKTSNVINKKNIKRTTKHTTKQKQSTTLINKTITRHRQKSMENIQHKQNQHPIAILQGEVPSYMLVYTLW
jgi:S-methylmethionine-dependent homocysteine/selenocysteine methylase